MTTLEITREQLQLIQQALDFYSRIGIGQFEVIKDHPTFEKFLGEHFRPKKSFEVGDNTNKGKIIKLDNDKATVKSYALEKNEYVKIVVPVSELKHSIDYDKYHETREVADKLLNMGRGELCAHDMPKNGSWGIHNKNVDDSCRMAFDLVQVIRHEFWKEDKNRRNHTVDSSVHFTYKKDNSSNKVKVKL